jgi:tetratricopeptide (TPR) repeat protein
MRRCSGSPLLIAILVSFALSVFEANAQVDHITIAAGTDEDKALQAITGEQDPQKKLAMYQDFVQKFSANPGAVAYGNWQIAQAYQASGDVEKALDYGDKALVGSPRNLDILVLQASLAQQAKNYSKLLDYVAKGADVCHSIGKQPKPEGVSAEDFAQQVNEDKTAAQSSCDFLETCGFNAIQTDNDPKSRMTDIEKFSAAFPDSKYQDTVSSYALDALSQLKDNARLLAYADKALTANPNSLPALLLLANFYSEDTKPGSAAKAISYSQKAIEVAKADAPDADKSRKLAAGAAHSTIGWAYLKQEKTMSAIPELRTASVLLKGQDDQQYARALYGLGFAYAKLNKLTEARDVLTEAVSIPGPLQAMSRELLTKVNIARAKGK